ncbi:MAG: TonB-dependent receptor [Bryobacteraceae bacterium]|nr:TonB-dependent receptor [Bryobacteraceae bacterium]
MHKSQLVFLLLSPLAAMAAVVSGVVLDPSRVPVPGAQVTLQGRAPAVGTTVITAPDGRFQFADLAAGEYTLGAVSGGLGSPKALPLKLARADERATIELVLAVDTQLTSISVVETPERSVAAKSDVSLGELPVTVETLSAELARQQGSTDLVAVLRYANNVFSRVHFGVYEHFTVRGFGDVIQMVDGIRQEDRRFNTQLVNVEQVELLKGPASALYGNNALGGSLNVIRKKPRNEVGLEASLSGGTWNNRRGYMGLTGPLWKDKLLARFDYGFVDYEGFRRAPLRQHLVSGGATWQPTSRDQLNVNYQFNNDRFATDAGIPTLGANIPRVPANFRFNPPQDRALTTDNFLQAYYNRIFSESVSVRNVTSYRRFRDDYLSAESIAWALPRQVNRTFFYFDRYRDTLTNQTEATFRVKTGSVQHTLLAGYEFQRFAQDDSNANWTNLRATPIDLFAPFETQTALPPLVLNRTRFIRQNVNAPYFQDHVRITDRLQATFNLRLDPWRRNFRTDAISPTGAITAGATTRLNQFAPTMRAGAVYRLVRSLSVYGSFGTGFTPVLSVPLDNSILDPERGRQGEIGLRAELLGGRVNLTSAWFYLEKQNVTIALGQGRFTQAGRQRAQGMETTLEGYVSRRLYLRLTHGLTDAKFLEFFSGGQNLAGRVPAFAPRHTGSGWAHYQLWRGLAVGGGVRAMAKSFPSFFNTVAMPGYAVVDAAVMYDARWADFSVSMQNIGNRQTYFVSSVYNTQIYPGSPFGMLVTARFKWPRR